MSIKYRAIIKRPDEKAGHVTNISCTLENLQKTVEGPIETVTLPGGAVLIMNEEGKLKGLQHNFVMGLPPFYQQVVGTVVILGRKGSEFTDCPMDFKVWEWMLGIWGNVV